MQCQPKPKAELVVSCARYISEIPFYGGIHASRDLLLLIFSAVIVPGTSRLFNDSRSRSMAHGNFKLSPTTYSGRTLNAANAPSDISQPNRAPLYLRAQWPRPQRRLGKGLREHCLHLNCAIPYYLEGKDLCHSGRLGWRQCEGKRKEREEEKEDLQDIAKKHYCFGWPENIGIMR